MLAGMVPQHVPASEKERPLHGPALLGMDQDIYALCEQRQGAVVPPTKFEAGQDQKLVDACLSAKV